MVADSVYGGDGSLRLWLEERKQPYVLAVTGQYRIFVGKKREWAATTARQRPARAWKRLSGGAGSKDERVYEWTHWQIRTLDEDRCRWLLARRRLDDREEAACFVVSGPRKTTKGVKNHVLAPPHRRSSPSAYPKCVTCSGSWCEAAVHYPARKSSAGHVGGGIKPSPKPAITIDDANAVGANLICNCRTRGCLESVP